MQASGTFQNLSGIPIQAAYPATNAVILPSLGRNLSAGPASDGYRQPDRAVHDVRGPPEPGRCPPHEDVPRGPASIEGMLDVYNVLNANTILVINQTVRAAWLRPQQILDGRLFKIGGQFDF